MGALLLVLLLLTYIKRSTSSGLRPICCNHLTPAIPVPICDQLLAPVIPLIKVLIGPPANVLLICEVGLPLTIAPIALNVEPL